MVDEAIKFPDMLSIALVNEECENWYQQLLAEGVDESVAADRVWDAMQCGLGQIKGNCFDKRDYPLQQTIEEIINAH